MRVYNGEQFLREAITSILAQSHRDFELIIVDDASTDGTDGILEEFDDWHLRVIRHKMNRGRPAALQTGINAARSPYIAFIDADDTVTEDWLATMLSRLDSEPYADIVSCALQMTSPDGDSLDTIVPIASDHSEISTNLLTYCAMNLPGSVGRTEVFQSSAFESTYVVAEDYYMWVRLLVDGRRFAGVPHTLYGYRQHSKQSQQAERDLFSEAHRSVQADLVELLWPEASVDQRREIGSWLHWRYKGRSPDGVQVRTAMDRSLRASRYVLDHPPDALCRASLFTLRQESTYQELVVWGGNASLAVLAHTAPELRFRDLLRCVLRSVTGR